MQNIWIPVIIITALVQTLRNGLMKDLKQNIDDKNIMLLRFMFSIPFVIIAVIILYSLGFELPKSDYQFFIYASIAATCQVIAGLLFLKLLTRRNFIIGVTYNQTQVIMNVILSSLLFLNFVSTLAFLAIILSFIGVVMITIAEENIKPTKFFKRLFSPSAIIGLGCGFFFGLTGVLLSEAISYIKSDVYIVKSVYSLIYFLLFQTICMLIIALYKKDFSVKLIKNNFTKISLVGLTNSLTTLGWFIGFSLTHSAHVYMLAQVEVIFSILISRKIFKETVNNLEYIGIGIILFSIVLLVQYK